MLELPSTLEELEQLLNDYLSPAELAELDEMEEADLEQAEAEYSFCDFELMLEEYV